MITGTKFIRSVIVTTLFLFTIAVVAIAESEIWVSDNRLAIGNRDYQPIETKSKFTNQIVVEDQTIPFGTKIKFDNQRDQCLEPLIEQLGTNGVTKKQIEISFYQGQEFSRKLLSTQKINPIDQIEVKGTQIVFKNLSTSDGNIAVRCNLGKFRATAYDSRCLGCSSRTATGMQAGYGVVAVDPKVIPLHSKLYITGYGYAVAGDTGGAIKGKKIDLGFEQVDRSWGVRDVEVYLL